MKKLFFAVIAAVAMVSVSNVFAGNRMVSVAGSEPVDTVAPADTTETTTEKPAEASLVMSLSDIEPTDTVAPAETPAPTETPADTTNTPADSTVEQAQ